MSEFKIIPQAPDYKINKDEEVRRVSNEKPLFIIGGKALLKTPKGTMEHFIVAELVKELFSDAKEVKNEPKKHINIDPLEQNLVPEITQPTESEILAEQSETNESEDSTLIKEEPAATASLKPTEVQTFNILPQLETPLIKKGRGRPKLAEGAKVVKIPKEKALKVEKVKKEKVAKVPKVKVEKVKKEKVAKERKVKKELPSSYLATTEIASILALDCSDSVKIWKLFDNGCAIPEILFHLGQKPTQAHSARGIICRYRNNKKLKDKASLIK